MPNFLFLALSLPLMLVAAGRSLWAGRTGDPLEAILATLSSPSLDETLRDLGAVPEVAELRVLHAEDPGAAKRKSPSPELSRQLAENLDLIDSLRRQGRFAEAAELGQENLELIREAVGDDHWYARDAALFLESLAAIASAGSEDREMLLRAEVMRFASLDRWFQAEYDEAVKTAAEEVRIRQALVGWADWGTLQGVESLAAMLTERGQYVPAEALLRQCFAARKERVGLENINVANTLVDLAAAAASLGRYRAAELLHRKALETLLRLLGGEHADVASSWNDLGFVLHAEGLYEDAASAYETALSTRLKLEGPGTVNVIRHKQNLAVTLGDLGKWGEAEVLLRGAIAELHAIEGAAPLIGPCMHNLATILRRRGRYVEADHYLREAITAAEGYCPDPWVAVRMRSTLGLVVTQQGRYDEAVATLTDAIRASECLPSEDSHTTDALRSNLATALERTGKFEEAEQLRRAALGSAQDAWGEDHPDVGQRLIQLAGSLGGQGRFEEALKAARAGLGMQRRLLGADHPALVAGGGLSTLASLLQETDDVDGAEATLREALGITETTRSGLAGSELERAMVEGSLGYAEISAELATLRLVRDDVEDALAIAERSRGRGLLELLTRSRSDLEEALRHEDPALAALLAERRKAERTARVALIEAEDELRRLGHAKGPGAEAELVGRQMKVIAGRRRALWAAQASTRWAMRAIWPAVEADSPAVIQEGLDAKELMLSYTWGPRRVVLIVVPPGERGELRGFLLAEGKEAVAELAVLVQEVAAALRTEGGGQVALQRLREAIIPERALDDVLKAKRLVVLPDGPLNAIPFEPLVVGSASDQGNSLLDVGPVVVYAPSATIYLNLRLTESRGDESRSTLPSLVALADPVFGHPFPRDSVRVASVAEGSVAQEANLRTGDLIIQYGGRDLKYLDDLRAAPVAEALTGRQGGERLEPVKLVYWRDFLLHTSSLPPGDPGSSGLTFDRTRPPAIFWNRGVIAAEREATAAMVDQFRLFGGVLPPLPGARKEAHDVARIFQHCGGSAQLLVGEAATAARLEAAVVGAHYIHLATHGLLGTAKDPYLASIALTRPNAPTPDDIGFLTLESLLDRWRGRLDGCRLVVLAACETQLGPRIGASRISLPWGFFYAGAPSVVASLWKVESRATALLMHRFYENLLGLRVGNDLRFRPLSKAQALAEAKRWLKGLSSDDAKATARALGLLETEAGKRSPDIPLAGTPRDPWDFSQPHSWAAFVLVGRPD